MDDFKYLCMGCMSRMPSDTDKCPNCGYTNTEQNLPHQLKSRTILNDRYIIGKVLNDNGESILYLAYDKVKEERVCIREFMPDTLCSRKPDSSEIKVNTDCLAQYKTLLSEFIQLNKDLVKLRTISQIQTVYEMFPQNNTAYAVLEYVDGITLNDYLRIHSGELVWDNVKDLFTQIFTALNIAHENGVIHKGISPDTIYILGDASCKITGFCIGEVRTANTEIAAELFQGYTAPEQYSVSKVQGPSTDVYSLAAVLYRCLTGVRPADALTRIADDKLDAPVDINEEIPQNVSDAIMNALAVSYEKRTQNISEFLTKLFEQSETQPSDVKKLTEKEMLEAEKSNVSLALKVGLITFAILAVVALILIWIFVPDRSSSDKSKVSITSSTSSVSSTTTTTEATTTTTSSTTKQYLMPNFVGLEYIRINVASYNMPIVLEPEYVYTTEHKKGEIYEQSVEPGTEFSEETTITVKVSKGDQIVKLPSYDGKNVSDYVSTLNSLGIKYEVIYDDSYPDIDSGMIIYVRSANGNRLDASTNIDMEDPITVYVVVSSYTEIVESPPTTSAPAEDAPEEN